MNLAAFSKIMKKYDKVRDQMLLYIMGFMTTIQINERSTVR